MPVKRRQLFGQFLDRLLVKSRLRFAQHAPCQNLGLLRKIGNNAPVRLEPAQDVRPGEMAQGRKMTALIIAQPLDRTAKLGGAAKQSGTVKSKSDQRSSSRFSTGV